MSVPNTFVPGVNTSFSSELNENFLNADYRSLSSNSTTSSPSAGATTTVATLSVAAGAVTQFIQVFVDFSSGTGEMAADASADLVLDIGEAGSETTKITQRLIYYNWNTDGNRGFTFPGGTFVYYYEPTAGEKSAGFNVKVKTTIGAGAGTFTYERSRVMGK